MRETRTIEGQAYGEVAVEENAKTGKPQLSGQRRASVVPSPEERGGQRRSSVWPSAGEQLSSTIYARNEEEYQFLQARGLVVLETAIRLVAVIPMGMAEVSSVITTAELGREFRKEELSYFQYLRRY